MLSCLPANASSLLDIIIYLANTRRDQRARCGCQLVLRQCDSRATRTIVAVSNPSASALKTHQPQLFCHFGASSFPSHPSQPSALQSSGGVQLFVAQILGRVTPLTITSTFLTVARLGTAQLQVKFCADQTLDALIVSETNIALATRRTIPLNPADFRPFHSSPFSYATRSIFSS